MEDLVQLDLTTVLVFVFVFVCIYWILQPTKRLPPGPRSYPLVGSIGLLKQLKNGRPHEVLAEAAKQYGGIISIWVGPTFIVILNGYDSIHKAFVRQSNCFSDRPYWIPQFNQGLKDGNGMFNWLLE